LVKANSLLLVKEEAVAKIAKRRHTHKGNKVGGIVTHT
jgi:hypothetical protein